MKPLAAATVLGLTLVASACGLSLSIGETSATNDAETPDAARAAETSAPSSPCTVLLSESFTKDEGDLDTVGRDTHVEGERLTLVRRDDQDGRGAA